MSGTGTECKIENSLLCFISTARMARTHNEIINSAANFYDDEIIMNAKKLIYNKSNKQYTELRISGRIKMNLFKKTEILEDIMRIFVEAEAEDKTLPSFVATAWNSMPVLSSDYDPIAKQMLSITTTINDLQTQLLNSLNANKNKLCSCKNEFDSLKQDIQIIKNQLQPKESDNLTRVDRVLDHVSRETTKSKQRRKEPSDSRKASPTYANIASTPPLALSRPSNENSQSLASPATVSKTPSTSILVKNPNIDDNFLRLDIPTKDQNDDDSQNKWIQYQKRTPKRREACLLSRQRSAASTLQAAPSTVDIFVGNCLETTETDDIKNYCVDEHNIVLISCKRLNSKIPYKESFKISVFEKDSELLLNKNSWPTGIFPRKFVHVARNIL